MRSRRQAAALAHNTIAGDQRAPRRRPITVTSMTANTVKAALYTVASPYTTGLLSGVEVVSVR